MYSSSCHVHPASSNWDNEYDGCKAHESETTAATLSVVRIDELSATPQTARYDTPDRRSTSTIAVIASTTTGVRSAKHTSCLPGISSVPILPVEKS